ncbi:MAG: hypothetical protein PHS36_08765 [Candidatus Cloacimonetes bacterium]|nr:hypothetical protein [Candidatus Cloacimonadota bacterium]
MSDKLSIEQAVEIFNSEVWKTWTKEEIVKFQLFTPRMCMPFDIFHEAVESILNRPVWTHEFAYLDELQKEYLGDKDAPTFEEIVNLIPEEKRLVVFEGD